MKKLLLLILTTFSICSFGQMSLDERIDSILAEQVENKLSPGLTVEGVKDGKLIYHSSNGGCKLNSVH